MPKCGSQCYLCDFPIRFDTYQGCSHGCRYCFANKFADIKSIKKNEGVDALISFIKGNRLGETSWCDWDIPLHWGGLSDPFQPCEKIYRNSYECLKILKDTQYPFIVSTKGRLVADDEYLDLLAECNCVVQISAVCSKYDDIEKGCPTYDERIAIISKVSKRVRRVIVRIQPYMHEVFDDVYSNLERIKEAGAYGVIIEGMKFDKGKDGLVKIGGDYCYPYDLILMDFMRLKEKAHSLGLKIYAGENRIRKFGDSLSCCGVDGLQGFNGNHFNLNHLLNGDNVKPTEKMLEKSTGRAFACLFQVTSKRKKVEAQSFAFNMIEYYKNNKNAIDNVLGVKKRGVTNG